MHRIAPEINSQTQLREFFPDCFSSSIPQSILNNAGGIGASRNPATSTFVIAPVMSCLANISYGSDSDYLEKKCDLGNEFVSVVLF